MVVRMVAEVAQVLARVGQRGYATGRNDAVFPGDGFGHLDASALRRRFVAARDAAGLRPLRFHDLRHTFGSLAINRASIVQVQAWMGHADAKTRCASQDGRMRRLVLVRRIFRGLDNRGVEGRKARAAYDLWRTSRA